MSYFLRVFKYDFSQWPKTLYNTYVYIINCYTLLYRVHSTPTTCVSCPSFVREYETASVGLWPTYTSHRRTLYYANCSKVHGITHARCKY